MACENAALGVGIIQEIPNPIAALTECRARGLPWAEELTVAAAGRLRRAPGLLQWLIESGCPWDTFDVMHAVLSAVFLKRGNLWATQLEMLEWLWVRRQDLSLAQKSKLLGLTARDNQADRAQWLHDTVGAPWPDRYWALAIGKEDVDLEGPPIQGTLKCWSFNCFKGARASGAPWGNWRCQMFNEAWYEKIWVAGQASRILDWAHENGCPCTCAHLDP